MSLRRYTTRSLPQRNKENIVGTVQGDGLIHGQDRALISLLVYGIHCEDGVLSTQGLYDGVVEWWLHGDDSFICVENDTASLQIIFVYTSMHVRKQGMASRLLRVIKKKATEDCQTVWADCRRHQTRLLMRNDFVQIYPHSVDGFERLSWSPNGSQRTLMHLCRNATIRCLLQTRYDAKLIHHLPSIHVCLSESAFRRDRVVHILSDDRLRPLFLDALDDENAIRDPLSVMDGILINVPYTIPCPDNGDVEKTIPTVRSYVPKTSMPPRPFHRPERKQSRRNVVKNKSTAWEKEVRLEQCHDHAERLREAERRRVEELTKRQEMVHIGFAIQNGL